jgi:hypothetical protein
MVGVLSVLALSWQDIFVSLFEMLSDEVCDRISLILLVFVIIYMVVRRTTS